MRVFGSSVSISITQQNRSHHSDAVVLLFFVEVLCNFNSKMDGQFSMYINFKFNALFHIRTTLNNAIFQNDFLRIRFFFFCVCLLLF